MAATALVIAEADPLGADATALLAPMFAEALARYGDVLDPAQPPSNQPLNERSVFLIAHWSGELAGCGALRPLDTDTAEVRRMFVLPAWRRRGVARALLDQLVRRAAGLAYRVVRLETGNRQPEAIALYQSAGFVRIAPFGPYSGDPLSVCFEVRCNRAALAGSAPA